MSTHLYHGSRLARSHLLEIAAFGFEAVEVRATRTHFDYHSAEAIADLQQWLAEARLRLQRVHAPVSERFGHGGHDAPLILASSDQDVRLRALEEASLALDVANRLPFEVLVVHLGAPSGSTSLDGARRSIEALQARAEPLGVRLAIEVLRDDLSRPESLVRFVDRLDDVAQVGICLDVGHTHLEGDVVEAIETVSEHLIAIDLHDNRGGADDHLVPLDGTIDWPGALTALQKVGYENTLMLELGTRGSTRDTLGRARSARQSLDALLIA